MTEIQVQFETQNNTWFSTRHSTIGTFHLYILGYIYFTVSRKISPIDDLLIILAILKHTEIERRQKMSRGGLRVDKFYPRLPEPKAFNR